MTNSGVFLRFQKERVSKNTPVTSCTNSDPFEPF